MNLVTWNVKGLGRPAKRFLVKDFLNLHITDVCCLQESKLEDIPAWTWKKIGGPRLDQFLFLPARGSTGGIIIGWNSTVVEGRLANLGDFSLSVDFKSKKDTFCWRCTTVYGPTGRNLKSAFWGELHGDASSPWVLCGDFNAIFSEEDKASGHTIGMIFDKPTFFCRIWAFSNPPRWVGGLLGRTVRRTLLGSSWIVFSLTALGRLASLG
ncbi:Exodeoxyribonuclease III protein [Dioscorea alata]|uniref:Exodeoxyribonuclease III protein n=1 Tax=Dioscorea alata TaxID=55571 RepID=A0ACB7U754_DIOAL|nr:Exodeoxyribonuclease III protein [Dioscorea alata]